MTDAVTLTFDLDDLALAVHKTRYGNEDPDYDLSIATERARWIMEMLKEPVQGREWLDHEHEWVSAVNEAVVSGEMCAVPGCGFIRASEGDS